MRLEHTKAPFTTARKPRRYKKVRGAAAVLMVIVATGVASQSYVFTGGTAPLGALVASVPPTEVIVAAPEPAPLITEVSVDSQLASSISRYETEQESNVAVAVFDPSTAQWWTTSDELYISASAIKVAILEALLLKTQEEDREMTADEERLASAMITISDNEATTALFRRVGGKEAMEGFYRSIGATTTANNVDSSWGLTKTTAADQLLVVRLFADENDLLTDENRAIVETMLEGVVETQRWGIPAGVRDDSTALVKNGWLPYANTWHVNSIGHVKSSDHDYAIAVLATDVDTEAAGRAIVEGLVRIVDDHMNA